MSNYIYSNNKKQYNRSLRIWWLKWFLPKIYVKKYDELPISLLKNLSIKILVCDMDNTLVPYYKNVPRQESIDFVKKIKAANIKFILVSNNFKSRVSRFARILNADDYYWFAKKPFYRVLKVICKKYNANKSQIIVMGDQVLTDILMANLFGCLSILVLPLLNDDKSGLRIVNYLNHIVYKRLSSNNLINLTKQITANNINKNEFL